MAAELIIGGARSGKSALAEQRARQSGLAVTYVATGQPGDAEMAGRIAHHRQRRPAEWGLIEEPLTLVQALTEAAASERCLLVDCLTLWLSNLLFADPASAALEAGERVEGGDFQLLRRETSALVQLLPTLPGRILLVTNEVGWGIVPLGALTRFWMDEAGRLNQCVAARCQRVTLVVAGCALEIKAGSLS
jgi:adenosylcobinamide kinase/adenosylcobinamide-phosphate guanylyltransferase